MGSIAIMATYPKRRDIVGLALESIVSQVDKVVLIANGYKEDDITSIVQPGVEVRIPTDDLKDTGKFSVEVDTNAFVYLCDDDIVYPPDYAYKMRACYLDFERLSPVVGVHGVIYPDFFDGTPESRSVYPFDGEVQKPLFANQLGTGTVLCRGYQLPLLPYMAGSAGFVDLRFGIHCQANNFSRICIARPNSWLSQLHTSESIFDNFTRGWPIEIVREAQHLAGARRLPKEKLASRQLDETKLNGRFV